MNCDNILAIKVDERKKHSVKIQSILTKHGCEIMARLGLPQQDVGTCTDVGLMILQICGDKEVLDKMVAELNQIDSVSAKYMTL